MSRRDEIIAHDCCEDDERNARHATAMASLTRPRFTAESEWRADSSIGIAIGKRTAIVAERRLEASADIAMRCGHDDFAGSAI